MASRTRVPTHPGSLLKDELEERGITLSQLARDLCVPVSRVTAIASGRRSLNAETALRLERYLGIRAKVWLNLQTNFDLGTTQARLSSLIQREVARAA